MTVWATIADILRKHGACTLVTVLSTEGSCPRESGARMVVRVDRGFSGTIGGGQLEFEAIELAAGFAGKGKAGLALRSFSLGPDLGQCCGGRVRLAIETMTAERLEEAEKLADREKVGPVATRTTLDEQGRVRQRQILDTVPRQAAPISLQGSELLECFGSERTALWLFGAGHVGRALVLALAPLHFNVTWVESRADAFPGFAPQNTRSLFSEAPEAELGDAPNDAMILVMTHSHALDQRIADAALRSERFSYVGVIGSMTKRARMLSRFKAAGINDAMLQRFVCPIGLASIRSKLPAAIAVSVVAELLEKQERMASVSVSAQGLAPAGRAMR